MTRKVVGLGFLAVVIALAGVACGTANPVNEPGSCASGGCSDSGGGDAGLGGDHAACGNDTWSNFASGFFNSYCASCHGWASSHSNVASNASGISSRLSSGNMPPSGSVSSSDRQRAIDWLGCGAP